MSESNTQKLMRLEKKKDEITARIQQAKVLEKERERKERTRKLIQMGALAEKYLDLHSVENLEKWLQNYVGAVKN